MRLISFAGMVSLATGITAIAISFHAPHSLSNFNTTTKPSCGTAQNHSTANPSNTVAAVCVSAIFDRASPWAEPSALTAPCGQFSTLCNDEKYICLPTGAKMAARAEETLPSPPLQPATVLAGTITGHVVASSAPLRPTFNTVVTVTTTAPVKRGNETAGWYLECTGDEKAWVYGNVCTDHDFILPVDKQECDQWCSCDANGKMHCASPVGGCEDKGQVTTMCSKGSTAFSCQCRKLGTEQKDQATLTKRAEAAGAMTTMYGVHYDPLVIEAIYVPQSWSSVGSQAFHDNNFLPITPTTEIVGNKYPGTSLTGPTTQDQPFPPDQTTSIYGLFYDPEASATELVAYVVANKDRVLAEDVWSKFTITSVEVNTAYSTDAVMAMLAKAAMVKRTAVGESAPATSFYTASVLQSSIPESSTTMYGVGFEGDSQTSHLVVSAVVVASTDTQKVLSEFTQASMSQITPSTVLSQSIPTAVLNKGNADAQPTTVYGLAYESASSGLAMPAAVVPHSRVSFVQSAYSSLNITQIEPHTKGVYHPAPTPPNVIVTKVTTIYLETVTVTATAVPHRDERFVIVDSHYPHDVHKHNVSLPYPHWTNPHATEPTTFSTMTMSKGSSPLEARDMHLQCDGNLDKNFLANICDSTEIWLSGNYCKAHCGCTDAGVVQCDTRHEPEFIDDCGGTDTANGFCSNAHDGMRCYCTG